MNKGSIATSEVDAHNLLPVCLSVYPSFYKGGEGRGLAVDRCWMFGTEVKVHRDLPEKLCHLTSRPWGNVLVACHMMVALHRWCPSRYWLHSQPLVMIFLSICRHSRSRLRQVVVWETDSFCEGQKWSCTTSILNFMGTSKYIGM